MRLAAFLIAAILLMQAGSAHAQNVFTSLEGSWTGNGWAIRKPGAPREAVRCRIRVRLSESDTRVDISGQCASPGNRSSVNGYLKRQPNGTYTGRWSNPRGLGTVGLSGTGSGERITLRFDAEDPDTGEPISGTMNWTFGGAKFSISGTLKAAGSAKSEPSGVLTFTR
jgi:hypothetical protein